MSSAASQTKDTTKSVHTGTPAGSTVSVHSRFTRAEKRKFGREHKVALAPKAPKQSNTKPKDNLHKYGPRKIDISKLSPEEIDTYIALLEAKARAASAKPNALADRVTREDGKVEAGEKPKKELSAAKLEKIEKRRQARLAKKEEWRVKKAVETGTTETTQAAPTTVPAKSPVRTVKDTTEAAPVETLAKSPTRTSSNSKPAARRASTVARSPARKRSSSVAAPALSHPEDSLDE